MALEYGFYDSINSDRRYSANQMSGIFEGVITDGVYASVGEKFFTTPGTGLQVLVGTGRAWCHETWSKNRAKIPLSLSTADPTLKRIDSVVLEVNKNDNARENTVKILRGTPSTSPTRPTLPSVTDVYYLRLADVTVRAGTNSILASDISIRVGTSDCPFVTSILQQTNIDTLFANWDSQFHQWFDQVQASLEGNVVTNLQNQINQKVDKSEFSTITTSLRTDVDALKGVVDKSAYSFTDGSWTGYRWGNVALMSAKVSVIELNVADSNRYIGTNNNFGFLRFQLPTKSYPANGTWKTASALGMETSNTTITGSYVNSVGSTMSVSFTVVGTSKSFSYTTIVFFKRSTNGGQETTCTTLKFKTTPTIWVLALY